MTTTVEIAYLNTLYPALSHTFIEREVRSVRAAGVRVRTFSIHSPAAKDRIGDAHAQAARETCYLLGSKWRLLAAQVGQFLRRPVGYIRVHVAAQRLSPPGVKARVNHVAYVCEAAVLATEMARHGLRHVHVHMANNGAAVAMLACVLDRRLTYSLSIHGSAEFFHIEDWTLRPKAERATFVRCISDFCKAQVMTWTSQRVWDRYHVVHCGINPDAFAPRPLLATSPLRIVTVGRIIAIKGYPMLLDACASLSAQGLDWHLTMVGDGPSLADLERQARDLGIADRVTFLGPVSQEDMPAQLDLADVMVISSFMEGIPVVLMEAMAKQLAVVATAVGGIPELVDDGVTGLLVPPASAPGLAGALARLARDRNLVLQLGRAARQKIVDSFAIEQVGRQMHDIFARYALITQVPVVPEQQPGSTLSPLEGVEMKPQPYITPTRPAAAGDVVPPSPGRRYVIVAPCRDEAKFCRKTIDSVIAQTIRPEAFVIVDDGSTDETPAILAEYAANHPFIKVIRRTDRGGRSVGPGVIEAFYHGYETVNPADFDYVCKLDLDLILPPRYFETLMERMEANPRLGNCSGKPYYVGANGEMISEGCGDENAIGASKFYRMECFRQIDGFVRQVMWDGIDGHRCRLLGWIAVSWDDPDIRFTHLRPMGSSHKGILTGRMRHGFGQYFMGTGLVYMTASAMFRMAKRPRVIGGAAMWWGYVRSMIKRVPQYGEPEFRRFLRRYQWECLLLGKMAATMRVNQRQAAAWRPPSKPVKPRPTSGVAPLPAAALAESLMSHQRLGIDLPAAPDVPSPTAASVRPAGARVIIAGVGIDNLTCHEAIDRIDTLVQQGRPSYVVTPNVDHVVRLQRDPDMREAYRRASLVLADGMPLLWAARFLGTPLKDKVSGSDLFPLVCELAARRGYRVFFLGGLPDAAQRASDALRARHPSLMVRTYCPPIGFDRHPVENAAAIAHIRNFAPHILFLGLGAPKQELWMHRHRSDCQVPVAIGVGASFDFVSGYVRRAPRLMQKTGLEWTWRLAQEPSRLYRRYLIEDPRFFLLIWKQKQAKAAFDQLWESPTALGPTPDVSAIAHGPEGHRGTVMTPSSQDHGNRSNIQATTEASVRP